MKLLLMSYSTMRALPLYAALLSLSLPAWAQKESKPSPLSAPASAPKDKNTQGAAPAGKTARGAVPKAKGAKVSDHKQRFTLHQLIRRASKDYPGIAAARAALRAMKANELRARWARLPRIKVTGLLAPSPEIQCMNADGQPSSINCVRTTNPNASSFKIDGIFGRLRVEAGALLYGFGKLSAAKHATRAGVAAERARIAAAEGDLELHVIKAYWGLKLAREILYTVRQGRKHLTKEIDRVDTALEKEEGDYTETDLKRLKTVAAVVDTRLLEAVKLERISRAALARLCLLPPSRFDVDKKIFELVDAKLHPLAHYLALARLSRPEIAMLNAAVRAQGEARRLAQSHFFPNLLLVASATVAAATGADDPENAFYNDPFNVMTAGIGLALSWDIDLLQQYGKYKREAAKAEQVVLKRKEALMGIDLEIESAYIDLQDAKARVAAAKKGQRIARSWLAAINQNLAAGLGKPKDLTDVLPTYFELKLKYLQAVFDVNVGWAKLARKVGKKQPKGDAQKQLGSN